MLGKTNSTLNGNNNKDSGEIVTAVNKTNADIELGQKVWLNPLAQTAASACRYNFNISRPVQYGLYLFRSGTAAWGKGKLFAIDSDTITPLSSFAENCYNHALKYGPDKSMFFSYNSKIYRADDTAQYIFYGDYIGGNYKLQIISGTTNFVRFNPLSGENYFSIPELDAYAGCYINIDGKIYSFSSSYRYYYTVDEEANQVNRTRVEWSGITSNHFYPLAVTSDRKYIIGGIDNTNIQTNLYMAEIIDDTHIKFLTQAEMPADLQPYYETKSCYPLFNPYTGLLTIAEYNGQGYLFMKYENGIWSKLPIDLGESYTFEGAISADDNLTRVMFAHSTNYAQVVNIKDLSGYAAVDYKYYRINENTITGFATYSAGPEAKVEVKTLTEL